MTASFAACTVLAHRAHDNCSGPITATRPVPSWPKRIRPAKPRRLASAVGVQQATTRSGTAIAPDAESGMPRTALHRGDVQALLRGEIVRRARKPPADCGSRWSARSHPSGPSPEQAVHRSSLQASGAAQRRSLRHIAHDGERAGRAAAASAYASPWRSAPAPHPPRCARTSIRDRPAARCAVSLRRRPPFMLVQQHLTRRRCRPPMTGLRPACPWRYWLSGGTTSPRRRLTGGPPPSGSAPSSSIASSSSGDVGAGQRRALLRGSSACDLLVARSANRRSDFRRSGWANS